MDGSTYEDVDARLLAYAKEFVRGYTEAVDGYHSEVNAEVSESEYAFNLFPLYRREVGVDTALAAFFTPCDFYLFFLDRPNTDVLVWKEIDPESQSGFDRDWTFNAPVSRRYHDVRTYLGIEAAPLLHIAPHTDGVAIGGTNFMASGAAEMGREGYQHGMSFGNQAGARAAKLLPGIRMERESQDSKAGFASRYADLMSYDGTAQSRGQAFEKLWRDLLAFYDWKPKKVRIAGEDNDFTAIFQGLHILGEVRWFADPMDGAKVREFLAKLDPRPQTIGLFISHSGVDAGGVSVLRRAVNTKTVVVFERDQIEQVFLEKADPGQIFLELLRDAYDYIFESD